MIWTIYGFERKRCKGILSSCYRIVTRCVNVFYEAVLLPIQILNGYLFDNYHNLLCGDLYTRDT